MKLKILYPSCNLETVKDGRGGIFTWIPEEPLVEFNLLYFQPGKTRRSSKKVLPCLCIIEGK